MRGWHPGIAGVPRSGAWVPVTDIDAGDEIDIEHLRCWNAQDTGVVLLPGRRLGSGRVHLQGDVAGQVRSPELALADQSGADRKTSERVIDSPCARVQSEGTAPTYPESVWQEHWDERLIGVVPESAWTRSRGDPTSPRPRLRITPRRE